MAPDPQRILLLALLPIGDTLFTTPMIRALRARYPQAYLTALVYRRTAALLRCVPGIDDVIVLPLGPDWTAPAPLLQTVRTLRARRYDVAIDVTSPAYKAISLLAGIPRRTYLKVDPLFWLLPGQHQRWRRTHATEHYYDAARELDLPPWGQVDHTLMLELPASAQTEARRLLEEHGVGPGRHPLVGLHAGGRWLEGRKQWPAERFAALARRLQQEWAAQILLLGGPEEAELARAIARAAGGDPIVAVGTVPLLTSLALVAACDLFVGNDSALLHGAAALGTSDVGLFGPACPANYAPVPCRSGQGVVVLPPQPCRVPQYFVGGSALWRRCWPTPPHYSHGADRRRLRSRLRSGAPAWPPLPANRPRLSGQRAALMHDRRPSAAARIPAGLCEVVTRGALKGAIRLCAAPRVRRTMRVGGMATWSAMSGRRAMMPWFGGMSLMGTTLLLLWVTAVLLLVWTVWTRVAPLHRPPVEAPLDILKRRYATGEISRAAYEQARQVLEREDA